MEMEKEYAIPEPTRADTRASQRRAPLTPLAERRVVFISHANPEDNAITAWLGARLAAAGYEVWTDLTRLLGGEEMWLDIDDALRFHARKVVVVLSQATISPSKEGVRVELDRAAFLRRKLNDRRFIIPIRIDDTPYEDFPPTISNRTVIDASKNPAAALRTILQILAEDGVPRSPTPSRDALLRWQQAISPQHDLPEEAEDRLIANWYPVVSLPKTINFFEISRPLKNAVTEPASIASVHPLPMIAHWRRLVSFGDLDEAQAPIADTTPLKLDHTMTLDEFLHGGDDEIQLEWGVPGNYFSSLIRQAWDGFAADAGLLSFMLSERTAAWYAPKGAAPGDKVTFDRVSGVGSWRMVSGLYGVRNRNWHFGATGKLMLGDPLRLKLTPHVIYTDAEGKEKPTAIYRRAHCKLWFNAKWRDLLYAYVRLLAGDQDRLVLPLSRSTAAIFSATPLSVSLPVRPPNLLERSVAANPEVEGDAEDMDVSSIVDDPAFSDLVDSEDDPFVEDGGVNDDSVSNGGKENP